MYIKYSFSICYLYKNPITDTIKLVRMASECPINSRNHSNDLLYVNSVTVVTKQHYRLINPRYLMHFS